MGQSLAHLIPERPGLSKEEVARNPYSPKPQSSRNPNLPETSPDPRKNPKPKIPQVEVEAHAQVDLVRLTFPPLGCQHLTEVLRALAENTSGASSGDTISPIRLIGV